LISLPTWISSEWQISDTSAQDTLISQFIDILESNGNGAEDKTETNEQVRKLLTSYANENASDALKEKLLFYTLSNPTNLHDVDLESLPSTSSNNALNNLKEIFLSGSLADLDTFFNASENAELVQKLDKENIKEKLQYVILADYCAKKVGQDVKYQEVADVLGLKSQDEEEMGMEVEIWVIASELFPLFFVPCLPSSSARIRSVILGVSHQAFMYILSLSPLFPYHLCLLLLLPVFPHPNLPTLVCCPALSLYSTRALVVSGRARLSRRLYLYALTAAACMLGHFRELLVAGLALLAYVFVRNSMRLQEIHSRAKPSHILSLAFVSPPLFFLF
jgi:hypothetical protein